MCPGPAPLPPPPPTPWPPGMPPIGTQAERRRATLGPAQRVRASPPPANKKTKPRSNNPEWNFTVSDLGALRLSEQELVRRPAAPETLRVWPPPSRSLTCARGACSGPPEKFAGLQARRRRQGRAAPLTCQEGSAGPAGAAATPRPVRTTIPATAARGAFGARSLVVGSCLIDCSPQDRAALADRKIWSRRHQPQTRRRG